MNKDSENPCISIQLYDELADPRNFLCDFFQPCSAPIGLNVMFITEHTSKTYLNKQLKIG